MKKYTKEIVLILITVIVISVISVSAAVHFNSENIVFEPEDTNWNVNNTSSALNDLYDTSTTKINNFKSSIAQAITDMGVATEVDADAETMANNIKSISGNSDSLASMSPLYKKGDEEGIMYGYTNSTNASLTFTSDCVVEIANGAAGTLSVLQSTEPIDLTNVDAVLCYYTLRGLVHSLLVDVNSLNGSYYVTVGSITTGGNTLDTYLSIMDVKGKFYYGGWGAKYSNQSVGFTGIVEESTVRIMEIDLIEWK
ncbi:MAG: hypothetical protein ACI31M_04805 [Bacilli bacterium]